MSKQLYNLCLAAFLCGLIGQVIKGNPENYPHFAGKLFASGMLFVLVTISISLLIYAIPVGILRLIYKKELPGASIWIWVI